MGQFCLAEEVEIACCQNASMPTALVAYFHLDYTFIHHITPDISTSCQHDNTID